MAALPFAVATQVRGDKGVSEGFPDASLDGTRELKVLVSLPSTFVGM